MAQTFEQTVYTFDYQAGGQWGQFIFTNATDADAVRVVEAFRLLSTFESIQVTKTARTDSSTTLNLTTDPPVFS